MPKKQSKPDFLDIDKDGNRKESMKKAVNDSKHGKKKKKKISMKESALIIDLLKQISEKNYSEANKYLTGIISEKLKNKIAKYIDQTIF